MRNMHKIAVDATFTQMSAKKGINGRDKRAIPATYKEYTKLQETEVMGALDLDIIKKSQKI